MAEVTTSRDMALRKLMYIMNTTEDDGVAAACAKTILDKADNITTGKCKISIKISCMSGFSFCSGSFVTN